MKIAFANFQATTKARQITEHNNCSITPPSQAHIVCYKIKSLDSLNNVSLPSSAALILFVATELSQSNQFRSFVSTLPELPFVLLADAWEEQLAFVLPSVLLFLELKRSNQKQQEDIAILAKQTDDLLFRFQHDLELATKVHHQLLPPSDLQIPGVSVTSKYLPAAGLGGDYFDVFELHDKKHLAVLVADSQTHGMASALLSSLLKVRLDELKESGPFAQNLMNHLNREIYQIHQSKLPGLDLVFGVLDRTTLTLEYASAGTLRPLLWAYPHFSELPCASNPPLGILPSHQYTTSFAQLRPGDLLFFHTNGLEAIFESKGESFRSELANLFTSGKKMDPVIFQTELLAKINRYQETKSELPDDITLIQLMIDKKALYLTQSK
ncbi:MAG: hypothetical protein EBQ92_10390 [Proteobacteria bacterium]|nr:hypothetical protein [Pseudomonadota bacterium]